MRKYHRWLSTLGMIFLLYVAITGTILQIYEISHTGPNILGPGGGPPPGPPGSGAPPPGARAELPPLGAFLQELHNGSFAGQSGRVIDLIVGVVFIVLSITGSVMYFQLLWRRRESGRGSWFWR